MIRSRCATDDGGPTMIRPSADPRANPAMPRSISAASRTPIGVNSTPNDGATVWIAANPPDPAGTAGSRITATRVTAGFALMRRGVFSVNFALWGAPREEFLDMCDYSLHSVRTRPAKVGEKLVTHNFGTGTRGF